MKGLRKACATSAVPFNMFISGKCWPGFFGNTPAALTIPVQSSGVVDVQAKLYNVVCRVER